MKYYDTCKEKCTCTGSEFYNCAYGVEHQRKAEDERKAKQSSYKFKRAYSKNLSPGLCADPIWGDPYVHKQDDGFSLGLSVLYVDDIKRIILVEYPAGNKSMISFNKFDKLKLYILEE